MTEYTVPRNWWKQHALSRRVVTALGAVLMTLSIHPRPTPVTSPSSSKPTIQTVTVPPRPLPKRPARPALPARRPLPPPVGHVYHIKWGDTLWGIAHRFSVSVGDLERANHLTSTTIDAGHYLVVPEMYHVQAGDTLKRIARHFGVPLVMLWHENRLQSDKLSSGQALIIPYRGRVPEGSYAAPPAPTPPLSSRGLPTFSPQDVLLIAHLVQSEAGNQPFVGQVAVAAVILNRLAKPGFPKTLTSVIFESNQFESVSNGQYQNAPGPLAFMAAKAALSGWDPTHGALYFYNPSLPHASWMDTLPRTAIIGNQVFCR